VLAVDDEGTNLRVLKSILTGDGYKVLTASSGLEAIEI
jgi:CheY-like chemotaxis protein